MEDKMESTSVLAHIEAGCDLNVQWQTWVIAQGTLSYNYDTKEFYMEDYCGYEATDAIGNDVVFCETHKIELDTIDINY